MYRSIIIVRRRDTVNSGDMKSDLMLVYLCMLQILRILLIFVVFALLLVPGDIDIQSIHQHDGSVLAPPLAQWH